MAADVHSLPPFSNEPTFDFSIADVAERMRSALKAVEPALGRRYGAPEAPATLSSTDPARPSRLIGLHATATTDDVGRAAAEANDAIGEWSARSFEDRAAILLRTSDAIRQRRYEMNAWLCFEVGKNWGEADAEVCEAIDFLELYARCALQMSSRKTAVQLPGEIDTMLYLPLGVAAVLPPWNFPLAIMAGMTMAALVAGNSVLVKPSPEAPTVAALFVEMAYAAGVPRGVLHLLQGGAEVGQAIVSNPLVEVIAFTGSKKVGLQLHEAAARIAAGRRAIRRTVLELGGKDAIVVLADADLELAAEGVAASAFGFSGQKCSACSRLIVDAAVHDELLRKIVAHVKQLRWSSPQENGDIAPLVNRAAYDRLLQAINTAASEGTLVAGGHALCPPEQGYFIAPTIVDGVASNSKSGQEEFFGPLLSVITANGLEDALRIANDTDYGLTGAIYSSSKESLERARRDFHVGNLYLNRKCTGAMVGAHPFGGFRLSGTNTKAGGTDYLDHFVQAKSIGERVMADDLLGTPLVHAYAAAV